MLNGRWLLGGVLLLILLSPSGARAVIQCSSPAQCCVDDVNETTGVNCTANDVTFVVVGLGVQDDGCVNSADTVSMFLGATLRNNTAQARYDIGMFIATDGDPNNDGALTGQCAREMLTPAQTPPDNAQTCPPLDLLRVLPATPDNGPYLTAESGAANQPRDTCGDLYDGGQSGCDTDSDGAWDDSLMVFTTAITFPCRDINADGFINIPTCVTWGNQANEIDDDGNSTCDSEAEVENGTPAKCRCEDTNSSVPAPNLACDDVDDAGVPGDERTVFCTPSTIAVGQSATCTVRYTNSVTCTPNLATPERFRCGTASYVRFRTDFAEAFGTVSGVSVSGSGTASVVTESGNQIILWTPTSGAGTSGVVAANETPTLTFTFTATAASTGALTFPTSVYWSNQSTFSPEVAQTVASCGAALTTPVTLSSFEAHLEAGEVVATWTTATELSHVGFNLYEDTGDGLRKVNDEPIAARGDSTSPRRYSYSFPATGKGSLLIEDIATQGEHRLHGPFELGRRAGSALAGSTLATLDWPAIRAELAERTLATRGAGAGVSRAVDLRIDREGVYRIRYEDLLAAGFDFGGTVAANLALTERGVPVPIRVVTPGGESAKAAPQPTFGPGSYVELYAQGLDTLYTRTNVYRLEANPTAALRTGRDPRAPGAVSEPFYFDTVRIERDREYSFGTPNGDPWYDTRMLVFTSPGSWSFDLPVDGYLPGAAPVTLAVDLWGSTDWPASPDHHVRLLVNGTPVADDVFDGVTARHIEATVPAGVVHEGLNTLTIELPADTGVAFDLSNLDRYSLTYPRAFQARSGSLRFRSAGASFEVGGLPSSKALAYRLDPSGPVRLTGLAVSQQGGEWAASVPGTGQPAEYLVTTTQGLLQPALAAPRSAADLIRGRADYLIVSHSAFLSGLAPLVAHHEAQGLRVRVVDVEDVYAHYRHGVFDPQAIQAYLADARARMGVRYVLLVGSDTYDYLDHLGLGSVSFVPTLYTATSDLITFAPSDPLLADVDGDRVPDLALGRLPVRTAAELSALISKTLAYSAKDYGRTAVFAADAFDARSGISFTRHSEDVVAQLPAGWDTQRAYLDRQGASGARAQLLASLDTGVALTSFIGHSGPTAWTFSSLLSAADARALTNAGAPTVVMQWGCWNTYFVEPRFDTLGHAFLASGDRGAAAVLGSSTLLETHSARQLTTELMPRLAVAGKRLGDAVLEAKKALAAGGAAPPDAVLGWTLLGDPALVIEP
ncbi:MAG TPA: C25 family cysteine peptidase [Thermoanaerobaculia bacterium]|nr:C25 family cysteine peptidase [Thermoanaerobaculia bacterium]